MSHNPKSLSVNTSDRLEFSEAETATVGSHEQIGAGSSLVLTGWILRELNFAPYS